MTSQELSRQGWEGQARRGCGLDDGPLEKRGVLFSKRGFREETDFFKEGNEVVRHDYLKKNRLSVCTRHAYLSLLECISACPL